LENQVARTEESTDVCIIGAGQAGLAMARELASRSRDFLVLDRAERVGQSWRDRWDSLRLFTPSEHDGLPGLSFPDERGTFPTKDDMAAYLVVAAADVVERLRLGCNVRVSERHGEAWRVETETGAVNARCVVVATGAHDRPKVPDLAGRLAPEIRQLHSSEYRNPTSVRDGTVIVVGAGASGTQIAIELAPTRPVFLAGRPTPEIPPVLLRHAGGLYWRFLNTVLTRSTPIGRRVAAGFHDRGAPLIGVGSKQVNAAGVRRLPRLSSVRDGRPYTPEAPAAGQSVATVIWATGYHPEFGWIPDLPCDSAGWPVHERGVVTAIPGLYLLGLPFQYALTSGLIGGVGRDARYLADRTTQRMPTRM
jgi:putative flavoprotein involved in K+ transport